MINRAESRFSLLKKYIFLILLVLAVCQSLIDSTNSNLISIAIIIGVACIAVNYCFNSTIFLESPLATVSLIGYWIAVQFGPLAYQTITFNSLTSGLHDGVKTFFITGIFFISLIVGVSMCRGSAFMQNLRKVIQGSFLEPTGLFAQPKELVLYGMGVIGLASLILTGGHDEASKYGDVSSKLVEAFRIFAYAPFARAIIPGVRVESRGIYPGFNKGLLIYVAALLFVGMFKNARGLMIIGVMTLAINSILMAMQHQDRIRIKASNLFFICVISLISLSLFSYLAEAMAAVRALRTDLAPLQMVSETLSILSDRDSVLAYLNSVKKVTQFEAYDEFYIENTAVARLVTVRFDDNMIFFGGFLDSADVEYFEKLLFDSFVAILPTPLVAALGFQIAKDDLIYSAADVVVSLATGLPMFGYKTGSLPGTLYIMYGILFPIFGVIVGFVGAFIFDNLSRVKNGVLEASPFALLSMYSIFVLFVQDSWVSFTFRSTRALLEGVILYILMLVLFGYRFRYKEVK